jgi:hypothetical protein
MAKKLATKTQRVCVYCGARATTRDHVPPRSVFVRPLPGDLITVPACHTCNGRASRLDERFRVMLSIRVGGPFSGTGPMWGDTIIRGIKRNRKLHKAILTSAKEVELRTPGGLYLGKRHAVPWDRESHDETIKRITRGLYFHHYGAALSPDTNVKAYWFRPNDRSMAPVIRGLNNRSIGGGQFRYAYGRAEELPEASVWFFLFHGAHLAGGFTGEDLLGYADEEGM